jgi:hypothetical protein
MPATIRHWTEEEEKALLELNRQGKPIVLIAKILKRTEVAISNKLALMKANGISY